MNKKATFEGKVRGFAQMSNAVLACCLSFLLPVEIFVSRRVSRAFHAIPADRFNAMYKSLYLQHWEAESAEDTAVCHAADETWLVRYQRRCDIEANFERPSEKTVFVAKVPCRAHNLMCFGPDCVFYKAKRTPRKRPQEEELPPPDTWRRW